MLTASLLLLMQPADAVPVPRTVNGQAIGPAERFAYRGPGRVCMLTIGYALAEGETAYLLYAGIHSASIRIQGPDGTLDLSEGDGFRPDRPGAALLEMDGLSITRHARGGLRYAIRGPGEESEEVRVIGFAEGDAVAAPRKARTLLSRLFRADGEDARCARRYNFGWDVMLGEQAVMDRMEQ